MKNTKTKSAMSIYDFAMELVPSIGIDRVIVKEVYSCGCCENSSWYLTSLNIVMQERFQELFEFDFCDKYITDFDYFTYEDNTLVLYMLNDEPCYSHYFSPRPEKVYCMDMPRPEGFEDVVKYHGITALSRTDLAQGIAHLDKVLNTPMYETCCATVPVGPLGAIFDADVITASNIDLYSHVDAQGRFYDLEENGDAYNGIIHFADQLEPVDDEDNNELVTINNVAKAIWVKIWAPDKYLDAAVMLAEEYGVELIILDEPRPRYARFFEEDDEDFEEIGDDEDWF